MSKYIVAPVKDLPPGARTLVNIKGRPIAVFNVAGDYFALLNSCPHRGASLCEGRLTGVIRSSQPGKYEYLRNGEILRCPWHGWEFDLRTGKSICAPDKMRARQYSVAVAPGQALEADKDVVLEKFSISVEGDYVFLDLP